MRLLLGVMFMVAACSTSDPEANFAAGGESSVADPDSSIVADGGADDADGGGDTASSSDTAGGPDDTAASADADGTGDADADAGADADADGGPGLESLAVTGFTVSECEGTEGSANVDVAYDEAAGHVSIAHNAHLANCCAEFRLTATGSPDGELSVVYDEGTDECDCECLYNLSYNLVGLPSGEWSISIPDGLSGVVTVP